MSPFYVEVKSGERSIILLRKEKASLYPTPSPTPWDPSQTKQLSQNVEWQKISLSSLASKD